MNLGQKAAVNEKSHDVLDPFAGTGIVPGAAQGEVELEKQVKETVRVALDHLFSLPEEDRDEETARACLTSARIELERLGMDGNLRAPALQQAGELLDGFVSGVGLDDEVLVTRVPIVHEIPDLAVRVEFEIDRVDLAWDGESVVLVNYCLENRDHPPMNDPLLLAYIAAAKEELGRPVVGVRRILIRPGVQQFRNVRRDDHEIASLLLVQCISHHRVGARFDCIEDGSFRMSPLS